MWLNQDSLARSLTHATSTPEVPSTYIHPFPSPEPPKNIVLLIRERIAKNISIFPLWNKCSSYLVTTTCYIISWDECSRKKRYEEIKRGKCLEPRKKRKVRRQVKMDKCPIVELGLQNTHLREKKKKSISFSSKVSKKARKVCIPSKSKRIRLSRLYSPSSPYTMHILIWLIDLFLWIHGLTIQ